MHASPDLMCTGEPMIGLSEFQTDEGPRYLPGNGGDTANAAVATATQAHTCTASTTGYSAVPTA